MDSGYINVRGTLFVFLIIELSYIRVLKGMKLPVGAKIRIDYKRVFFITEFLISGIHCMSKYEKEDPSNQINLFEFIWSRRGLKKRRRKATFMIAFDSIKRCLEMELAPPIVEVLVPRANNNNI